MCVGLGLDNGKIGFLLFSVPASLLVSSTFDSPSSVSSSYYLHNLLERFTSRFHSTISTTASADLLILLLEVLFIDLT